MNTDLIIKILEKTASKEEIEKFEQWINSSREHREQFEKSRDIWEKSGSLYQDMPFDKNRARTSIRNKVNANAGNTKKRIILTRYAAAASLLLLITMGILTGRYLIQNSGTEYYSYEQVKLISLPDSSQVWLNKHSSIKIAGNFGKRNRKVILIGEAFFEVKRDKTSPFKIHTGETVTEVLGTAFNIHMDTLRGDVMLTVASGKVAFYPQGLMSQHQTLLAGMQAEYVNEGGLIRVAQNTDRNYLAWKTGVLEFYNSPLSEVCEELSQYYNKPVRVDPEISGKTITGTFEQSELLQVLEVVSLTLDLEIDQIQDTVVLSQ